VERHPVYAEICHSGESEYRWTACVAAYKDYLTDADLRTAWRKLASVSSATLSGFNAAMKNLVLILSADTDASFVVSAAENAGDVEFTLENMDDGATGDEAGDFEVWIGTSATALTKADDVAIAAGEVTYTHGIANGTIYYAKLRKDSADRSGIFALTSATP